MTSREENVKKINDELEALSDEELDQIAGGSYIEVAGDSRFLNDLAGLTDRYGAFKVFGSYNSIKSEIVKGWSIVGITLDPGHTGSNDYYKDGQKISRSEAMKYAVKKYGRSIEDFDFTSY